MSAAILAPCACATTPTNPHPALRRDAAPDDGLPLCCTTPDPCGFCTGAGCDACGRRGYSQHCERRRVDGVETPGWAIPR